MRRNFLIALALVVALMTAAGPVTAHTVNVVLKQGNGGAHFSSHIHTAANPQDCGGGKYQVHFYLSWGTVTSTRVYVKGVTLKIIVERGRTGYRDLDIFDSYGGWWSSNGIWQTFGVGTYYQTYTINRWFRHDGSTSVVWSALTNQGGTISQSCSHNDIVMAS